LCFGAAVTIDKPFDLDEMIELVHATSLRKPHHLQNSRSRS
jgi:hypothetical protein